MNKPLYRRILAYILDLCIITLISSLFLKIEVLNPYKEKYEQLSMEYTEYINTLDATTILTDQKLLDYSYNLSYYGVYTSIITLVITILYFIVFQYFNEGKTIGKAVFKIRIVDKNNKRPTLIQIIIRSLIVNSIVTSSILIILVMYLSRSQFEVGSTIIEIFDIGLLIVCASVFLFREDRRGLHDLIAGTQVVNNSVEHVKEAKISENKISKKKKEE